MPNTNILSKDISIVIQGVIDPINTAKCIASARKFFPDSEIIVSTWENSIVGGLDCDRIILNRDPGCYYDDPEKKRAFNINRWIVSSHEGVKQSSRPYVLKMRSDCEIVSTDFLQYWDAYEQRDMQFCVAKHKLLIPSTYTLKYLGTGKKHPILETPLHVSDWYCFGYREDVLAFTSCPLIRDIHAFATYFEKKMHHVPYEKQWWIRNWYRKMAPEQYIGLSFIRTKLKEYDIRNAICFKNLNADTAEKLLLNNFIVLDPKQFGILLNKYRDLSLRPYILKDTLWNGMYRNHVYDKAYRKQFCLPSVPLWDKLNLRWKILNFGQKIKNAKIMQPILCFLKSRKARLFNWIKTKPILYIFAYSHKRLNNGQKLYNNLTDRLNNEDPIYICPYRGTGDSYIVGNYFRQKKLTYQCNFLVPRAINKMILTKLGIPENRILVLEDHDLSQIQLYQKVMQLERLIILHFAPPFLPSSIGYNLAGYRHLNFADFYDYIVFGEKKAVKYLRIDEPEEKIDYKKKYHFRKNRTVLLAPYSDSIRGPSMEDWAWLAKELRFRGYCVATNCNGAGERPIAGTKAISLPFEYMTPFLDWCGYFVSLRSGLCDIVCTSHCKKHILYPDYVKYQYGKYIDFFTLDQPERGSSAMEYEFSQGDNDRLFKRILASFQPMEGSSYEKKRYKKGNYRCKRVLALETDHMGR